MQFTIFLGQILWMLFTKGSQYLANFIFFMLLLKGITLRSNIWKEDFKLIVISGITSIVCRMESEGAFKKVNNAIDVDENDKS